MDHLEVENRIPIRAMKKAPCGARFLEAPIGIRCPPQAGCARGLSLRSLRALRGRYWRAILIRFRSAR